MRLLAIVLILCSVSPTWASSPFIACNTDSAPPGPSSGIYTSVPANDVLGLCSGSVALALRDANSIIIVNLPTGTTLSTFNLTASPKRLAYDADNGFVYATLVGTTFIAKIDISTGTVTYLATTYPGVDIAAGNCGEVFVSTQSGSTWWDATFEVFGLSGARLSTLNPGDGFHIDFDRMQNRLVAGVRGSSPSNLYAYNYNTSSHALSVTAYLWNPGSNGTDIAVSPDGNQTAFACGGGNSGTSYGISDFATASFGTIYGNWAVGAYPSAVAFSPRGSLFLASNSRDLKLYNATTHAQLLAVTNTVGSSDLYRVAFSRGSAYIIGLETWPSISSSKVYWRYHGFSDGVGSTTPYACTTFTPLPSPTSTVSPSASRTNTPSATETRTITATHSVTETRTETPSRTVSPSASTTRSSTSTPTASPTFSASPSFSETRTPSPSFSASPTFSQTRTSSPTFSASPTVGGPSGLTPFTSPTLTAFPPAIDSLGAPFPHPYLPGQPLHIPFQLSTISAVYLSLYDLKGQTVRVLVAGDSYPAGRHTKDWDGSRTDGSGVASGIYYIVLKTDRAREIRQLVVTR